MDGIATGAAAAVGIEAVADPFGLFAAWMREAEAGEPNDPNAMCLATASPGGAPSARMVLLKGFDAGGFVFYSHLDGRKGSELAANPRAALLFHWKSLLRQVRVEGATEAVSDADSDAYYASRGRVSRLGAWASRQSRPLAARSDLEARVAELEARHAGDDIPRPPHWGGTRVVPLRIEFWQDMAHRLHDRLVYERDAPGGPWRTHRLNP